LKAEPVTREMLRESLLKATAKPKPRAEFQEAMTAAMAPVAAAVEALEVRLANAEARAVEVLGLR
jgi:hypothetical protein